LEFSTQQPSLVSGHVFVSVITGNIVFLGLAAAGAQNFAVITSALAIGGFVVGVLIGGQACRVARAHRGRALRNVLGIKSVLAAVVTLVIFLEDSQFSDAVVYTVLVLLAMSMGAQLAVIRYLTVSRSFDRRLDLDHHGRAYGARKALG
jgi:uncharacterized membrane protein YoaK (UPF0700 family)